MHADIHDIWFFPNSAVDPKYCLPTANLFTSKTYTYPMKSSYLSAQKRDFPIMDFKQKGSRF